MESDLLETRNKILKDSKRTDGLEVLFVKFDFKTWMVFFFGFLFLSEALL